VAVSIMWFRRDLRLADNPALRAACSVADEVLPVYVLDEQETAGCGAEPVAFLLRSLAALDGRIDGHLVVRRGDPADVVARAAEEVGATDVFCAADFDPYGLRRDASVHRALVATGASLRLVGSPYAVDPGEVVKGDGTGYQVFTPFSRAWWSHGWGDPVDPPRSPVWAAARGMALPLEPKTDAELPAAGETAAHRALDRFLAHVDRYGAERDLPGCEGTSHLSPHLRWGALHPRQVLARLGRSDSERTFATELCWREFSGDLLYREPGSVRRSLQPAMRAMPVDVGEHADERFAAWRDGRTGYPIVDAGMRQLLGTGWMHNRVRMIVASFLVKDLHLDWSRGAAHFLEHLIDGDVASNTQNWQWVAGTGVDAAPYFRIFNPTAQGKKFDGDGTYVRRWVPELRDVDRRFVHEPWRAPGGPPSGYPEPIIDHAAEREESLARYAAVRSGSKG